MAERRNFNLEEANTGAAVVRRSGLAARFIAYVPDAPAGQRVVWFDGEDVNLCDEQGRFFGDGRESSLDLFMAGPEREVSDAECDVWVESCRDTLTDQQCQDVYMAGKNTTRALARYAIRERERAQGGAK